MLAAAMTAAAVAAAVSRSEAVTSYPRPPTQGRTCGVTESFFAKTNILANI